MGSSITVPYSGHISGGVQIGTDVTILGRTVPFAKRFSINICSGPNLNSDCIFHFNPRFDDGRVVRNHKQGGSWGMEETSGGMPFHRGSTFELHIKVENSGYKVTVNHHHFCNFPHRLPKGMAQYIYIEGEVSISSIQFRGQHSPFHGGANFHPTPSFPSHTPGFPPAPHFPLAPSIPSTPSFGGGPLSHPHVPLTTRIPGGIQAGKNIYISGRPNFNPSRFTINLACGASGSADYGLTFDARFNYGNCQNVVVRTHKQGGTYGPEERHQNYYPFTPGVNFEIRISVQHNSFKIAVNNQHFTDFNHRIHPLQKIDHLNIVGDVTLTQVRFQ